MPKLGRMRGISRLLCAVCFLLPVTGCHHSSAAAQSGKVLSGPGPTFTVQDFPASPTVIIYGDMRFTHPWDRLDADPRARVALVGQIAAEKPDALVLTGDVPFRGKDISDYHEFEAETAVWRALHLRVYPVLGNHELSGTGNADPLKNWWATFPELKNRRWYSVALGPPLYLLALDSASDLQPGSPERKWIEDQIAHLPSTVDFLFIALHHPPVADTQTRFHTDHNPRPNEIALRDYLDSVAAKLHARIIVDAGHIHNYERFERDGVSYLVSGGGGARPYEVDRTPSDLWQSHDFPNFHYVEFRLDGQNLRATMYRLNQPVGPTPKWTAADSFEIAAKATEAHPAGGH